MRIQAGWNFRKGQVGFAVAQKLSSLVVLLSLVLVVGATTALSSAELGEGFRTGQGILLPIKQQKNCCKACIRIAGQKVCKTFCGKGAKDSCDDFKDSEHGGGKGSGGEPKNTTEPKLEDHPCYPICRDKCSATRTNMTLEQCIMDCLNVTRCPG